MLAAETGSRLGYLFLQELGKRVALLLVCGGLPHDADPQQGPCRLPEGACCFCFCKWLSTMYLDIQCTIVLCVARKAQLCCVLQDACILRRMPPCAWQALRAIALAEKAHLFVPVSIAQFRCRPAHVHMLFSACSVLLYHVGEIRDRSRHTLHTRQ